MLNRRDSLKLSAALVAGIFIPASVRATVTAPQGPFRFCLNTSTISGQNPGLLRAIDIASTAGYDGMELWISDIRAWLKQGNTLQSLAAYLSSKNIVVENAISFTAWMVDDEAQRKAALTELEEEMKIMAAIGCHRIAAPPVGLNKNQPLDFQKAGTRYRQILALGRQYNVMPLLEFWGASGTLYNLSQAMAIAAAANDKDARILPDVYHLFRGGSGFEGLSLLNGKVIDIIHMNDYPAAKPVDQQTDSDRVYPGDGAAPLKQILRDLKNIGGTKVLSLELFNKTYWQQDPLVVATTGLQKMQSLVNEVMG
ncbi:TIM barrel protein [Ferruginibacter paludis]|uniref:sugar phosphate isomerase/epimerase family protein n=1 Tax=Ferruginibacter paludis TaxID=1310417 RepID=UPI0025B386D1|nr:TIM barrel protein [Ferruginibacter paludis]MDN3655735.1 TIM barrel protein [Ferruginibacter paludis]